MARSTDSLSPDSSFIFSFLFKGIQSSAAYSDLISYVPLVEQTHSKMGLKRQMQLQEVIKNEKKKKINNKKYAEMTGASVARSYVQILRP